MPIENQHSTNTSRDSDMYMDTTVIFQNYESHTYHVHPQTYQMRITHKLATPCIMPCSIIPISSSYNRKNRVSIENNSKELDFIDVTGSIINAYLIYLLMLNTCKCGWQGGSWWSLVLANRKDLITFQYPIRRLIVRSCHVSKPRDLYLELYDRRNLTVTSTVVLPRCLWNFKAMR